MQYLAIPLGDLAPAHREAAPWLRTWQRFSPFALTTAGCAMAAAALLITSLPRPISAFATRSHLDIGGVILQRAEVQSTPGYTLYSGAADVLLSGAGPGARSAGAATLSGRHATGACAPARREGQPAELCWFHVGRTTITSRDILDSSARTWTRTYSDGHVAVFAAPAGEAPVPIPLPLGD